MIVIASESKEKPDQFLLCAHYKGTITRLNNLGLIMFKSKEDLEHMQDILSKKPNIDTFDWFCFSFKIYNFD